MGTIGFSFPMSMAMVFNSVGPVSIVTDVAVYSGLLGNQDEAGALCIAGQQATSIVRGFSAVASVLSTFAGLAAMKQELGMASINGTPADSISDPIMMAGAIFGACLPLVCSGLNIVAVGPSTRQVVE